MPSWYLFSLVAGCATRVKGSQHGGVAITEATPQDAAFCLGQGRVVGRYGGVRADDDIDVPIRKGKEIVAVEDVGANKVASEGSKVAGSGQPVPEPSRAAHDDLSLDLVCYCEARDRQRPGSLEAGDDTVGGSVGEGELQGVGDIPVVIHSDQELLAVLDAPVVAHHYPLSHNLARRVSANLHSPPPARLYPAASQVANNPGLNLRPVQAARLRGRADRRIGL